eukprot:gnl/TRDRNA2_/TRDRNA2_173793_c0_seq2.p1 gnl/TRDRNA2_/TRDRNA2_173793_c0~~gnl/TRDRNA2_/TRDRNA2_173793_c0_seq2.p1  ORF type:complete len:379 (-),score=23.00 gnl/TRDRNA2_/TRDRNA2_173793_c0_seq2:114-1250(-)
MHNLLLLWCNWHLVCSLRVGRNLLQNDVLHEALYKNVGKQQKMLHGVPGEPQSGAQSREHHVASTESEDAAEFGNESRDDLIRWSSAVQVLQDRNVTIKIGKKVPITHYRDEQYVHEDAGQLHVDTHKVAVNLRSKSMLILGNSLDRHMVHWACEAASSPRQEDTRFYMASYCKLDKFTLATILNYGTGQPPYWSGSIHAPSLNLTGGAHATSHDHIVYDTTDFAKRIFGISNPPSVVVVDSSTWDLANWWSRAGRPKAPGVPPEQILHWCHHGVPELLGWVSSAFPQSRIAFRTPPRLRSDSRGRSTAALDAMTDCIREELFGKFDIIDFHDIVEEMIVNGKPKKTLYADALHPSKVSTLGYFNELLNYLQNSTAKQ